MKYTIIITVYNKEKYLERALKSACNQTVDDYKIMIINDGATDNSEKIIKKYLKNKKIEYYKKENTGLADTRNYSVERVKTDYFLFLDADDYVSKDLIETLEKYDDYDVLSFNTVNIDNNNKFIKNINKPVYEGDGETFLKKSIAGKYLFTTPWGYAYNTKYFKEKNFKYPKGKILEDFNLTPYIILESKKLISIDYYGYYYVTIDDSIINGNISLVAKTYLEHFDEMKDKNKNYNKEIETKFNAFLASVLIWYGSVLKGKERRKYIKKVKQKKALDLILPKSKRFIMKILYNLNIYYPIRKILKH